MQSGARRNTSAFNTDAARWKAVCDRNGVADGRFVYAVRTTGVYCRPSCGARRPRRENVEFFGSPAAAERAGFRACKRCNPAASASATRDVEVVTRACAAIASADGPPQLAALAEATGVSTSHLHRTFKRLTGLTPKAYADADRAGRLRATLPGAVGITPAMRRTGFNSASRLYATAPKALGMRPADYRAGGRGATIRFAIGECSLGSILVAATNIGVCAISFGDDPAELVRWLQDRFPKATLVGGDRAFARTVSRVVAFVERPQLGLELPLDVRGTAFQHRVWKQLIEIPAGSTRTYAQIAKALGRPAGSRAVGGACAANPIAVAIPCHRVLRTDGSLSGYYWGVERKARLLERERVVSTSTRS